MVVSNPGENIRRIRAGLPGHIKLVAISKTQPVDIIQEAYDSGHRCFGENKALELATKYHILPSDIEWHFVGHLQSNKVRYIAPFVHLIHSVDSLKLLREINKEGLKAGKVLNCLLQFHIAEEETKFGMSPEQAKIILASSEYNAFKNIKISGVMGMATLTQDANQVRNEFRKLKQIFKELKVEFFKQSSGFKEISMGMSDDYRIAVEEGSTIVRIGRNIFGEQ